MTSKPPVTNKRPRGRPSRASLLAAQADSTAVSTSAGATSSSNCSTPATSLEPTPAPSVADSLGNKGGLGTTIEIQIPALERAPSTRATRNGRFSLNTSSKRRVNGVVKDSDDEEEDDIAVAAPSIRSTRRGRFSLHPVSKGKMSAGIVPDSDEEDLSDLNPDERLARKLQEEEYTRLPADFSPMNGSSLKRNSTASFSQNNVDKPSTSITGKRQRGQDSGSSARPNKKAKLEYNTDSSALSEISDFVVTDSDEEGSSFGDADSDEEPLANRSKLKAPAKKPVSRAPRSRPLGRASDAQPAASTLPPDDRENHDDSDDILDSDLSSITDSDSDPETENLNRDIRRATRNRRGFRSKVSRRSRLDRDRLEFHHPVLHTMWEDLKNMPVLKAGKAPQPHNISRQLKPFQLEGLAWMKEMEKNKWKGGLLGDEMGLGKTIQAVSLIMSDFPAPKPTLVLVPPVALMQWRSEIASYTGGALKTFVYHGTNAETKGMTAKKMKGYNVIMMSYNSLESMYRKQEKGFKRKDGLYKEKSLIHSIHFHRIILDEAHCIKTRATMTAKACFALKVDYRWCLSGTPLQNRIGEFFSLIRFLNIDPFASYFCKQCPCSSMEWDLDEHNRCNKCSHVGMQHVAVFNQELLNPIQKFGSKGPGREAFDKLRLLTDKIMLRRLKKDHSSSMDLPSKEIHVDRQFFSEVENDFANSIMTNSKRKFETYVAQGVLLNNYANIFGLIMQMRQVADHPDLILKKSAEGGQNVLVCCICDESAEDAIRSRCKHDFCRECAKGYLLSSDTPDCPQCHIPLSIDLEQPEIEQDTALVKKSSIINRIKMENWTSSSKIELLVRDLYRLRSDKASHKSIIFSQFTSMLQLIEWRLRRAGLTTVMLDGSMTPAQRQASIDHFMNTPEVECFLVSLKAGGVALNLTEASRVFIVDP